MEAIDQMMKDETLTRHAKLCLLSEWEGKVEYRIRTRINDAETLRGLSGVRDKIKSCREQLINPQPKPKR